MLPLPLKKDVLWNVAFFLLTLGGLVLIVKTWGNDSLQQWVTSAGPWGPIVLVGAKASTIVFAPLSGALIYPLAGALFGFWKGLALSVLGDAIGGAIAFQLSRRFGQRIVERMVGDEGLLAKILAMMGTVRGFLITRLLLITAQDIVAYAAGLTKLPFLPFIIIHVGVSIVPTVLLTASGSLLLEGSVLNLGLIFFAMSLVGGVSMFLFLQYAGFDILEQNKRDADHA